MELIRTCKLPSHVIGKLQLEFPKSRSRKRYGAVGLDYGTEVITGECYGEMEGEPSIHGNKLVKGGDERERESSERDEEDISPVSQVAYLLSP